MMILTITVEAFLVLAAIIHPAAAAADPKSQVSCVSPASCASPISCSYSYENSVAEMTARLEHMKLLEEVKRPTESDKARQREEHAMKTEIRTMRYTEAQKDKFRLLKKEDAEYHAMNEQRRKLRCQQSLQGGQPPEQQSAVTEQQSAGTGTRLSSLLDSVHFFRGNKKGVKTIAKNVL